MTVNIKWKKEIQVGVVVGLIFLVLSNLLFQPLLNLVGDVILWLGNTSYNGFVDFVFKNAALGFREQSSTITLCVLAYILLIPISTLFLVLILVIFKRFFPLSEDTDKTNKNNIQGLVIGIASSFAIYLLLACSIVENYLEMQFISRFEQRLTVLTPRLTDQQVKELRAQWALMRNAKDYTAISEKINALACENHIKLP